MVAEWAARMGQNVPAWGRVTQRSMDSPFDVQAHSAAGAHIPSSVGMRGIVGGGLPLLGAILGYGS
jgi:hypothetical protein